MATTPSTGAGKTPNTGHAAPAEQPAAQEEEVIRIEDLAPRQSIKGGRKILLGEDVTRDERPL